MKTAGHNNNNGTAEEITMTQIDALDALIDAEDAARDAASRLCDERVADHFGPVAIRCAWDEAAGVMAQARACAKARMYRYAAERFGDARRIYEGMGRVEMAGASEID